MILSTMRQGWHSYKRSKETRGVMPKAVLKVVAGGLGIHIPTPFLREIRFGQSQISRFMHESTARWRSLGSYLLSKLFT